MSVQPVALEHARAPTTPMAIPVRTADQQAWIGPSVNGLPTKVHFLDREGVSASGYAQGMFEVINAAFSHGRPPYIPAEFIRLATINQMLRELGQGAFSFVVTQKDKDSGADRVIATGSAMPAIDPSSSQVVPDPSEKETTVDRSIEARKPLPGVVDWELKHLCVDPASMKQGLAKYLLGLLDQEVIARTTSMQVHATPGFQGQSPQIRQMITTIAEMNGLMYQKRGFRRVEFSSYPEGTLGGTAPFEVWHMDRIIE